MTARSWFSPGLCSQAAWRSAEPPASHSTAHWAAESESAPAGPAAARQKKEKPVIVHNRQDLAENYPEAALYLNALDEVPHWEVVVEEDADQHLHHFSIELKWEVMRQD